MSEPPTAAHDVLVYQSKPAARAEGETICAVLAGALAALFSGIVVGATAIEQEGVRNWKGVQVVGLWACLLLALGLAPTGLWLGTRLLLRRSIRPRRAWLAVALSVVGAALLVFFVILIGGLF